MALQPDKAKFVRLLRKNPPRTAPALPKTELTVAKLHRYKDPCARLTLPGLNRS